MMIKILCLAGLFVSFGAVSVHGTDCVPCDDKQSKYMRDNHKYCPGSWQVKNQCNEGFFQRNKYCQKSCYCESYVSYYGTKCCCDDPEPTPTRAPPTRAPPTRAPPTPSPPKPTPKPTPSPPPPPLYFPEVERYVADLGPFGTFTLEVRDDGTMSWVSDLENINDLNDLPDDFAKPIKELNYHLHASWNLHENYATGAEACGSANLGGHYDPYFACGPATAVPDDQCIALGRVPAEGATYDCSGSYYVTPHPDFAQCEVGDLSGKFGALVINRYRDNGSVFDEVKIDPHPAVNAHYEPERNGDNDPARFASVLFHVGAPRVLCAKLKKVYY